jgi:membrane-bound lytic murein transglycosylase D
MKTLKISKYILSCVLFSFILSGCNDKAKTDTNTATEETPAVVSVHAVSQQTPPPTSVQPASVWAELGENFQLEYAYERPEVRAQIAVLQANKEDLYKILKKSAHLISYVHAETQKRGLPAELALLPVVESEYNANARSRVGATGVWQFMPRTAADLGIKTNHAYDGRKDLVTTTHAAFAYLTDLHKEFKEDWLLAMAAYNSGSGRVQSSLGHQKKWYQSARFWELRLPNETKKYVPKILALAAIVRNPARYGFVLPLPENQIHLTSVQVHSSAELSEMIRQSGMSLETWRRVNPAYRVLATTQGAPNKFLMPVPQKMLASNTLPSFGTFTGTYSSPVIKFKEGIRLALAFDKDVTSV